MQGTKATGVEYLQNGQTIRASAETDVILSVARSTRRNF